MDEIELAIKTQKLEKELSEHGKNKDLTSISDLIDTLTEEEAKGILRHVFFNI